MTTKVHPLLATGALLLATALWGSSFSITQIVVNQYHVLPAMFFRSLIAVLVLISIKPKALAQLTKQQALYGLVIGAFLGTGYILQSWGLQHTTATASGFIASMFVVMTPLVGALLFKNQIKSIAWVAVVIATAGLGVMTLKGVGFGLGEAVTLITALMWTMQITLLSRWGKTEIAWAMTTLQMLVVTLMSLVLSLGSSTLQFPPKELWDELIFLGSGAGALALLLQTWAQAQISAVRAAILFTLEPVWGAVFSVWLVQDVITAPIAIGAGLIISAMLVSEISAARSRAPVTFV
jgi:drug/metabolite transporter (DMT)-like permease